MAHRAGRDRAPAPRPPPRAPVSPVPLPLALFTAVSAAAPTRAEAVAAIAPPPLPPGRLLEHLLLQLFELDDKLNQIFGVKYCTLTERYVNCGKDLLDKVSFEKEQSLWKRWNQKLRRALRLVRQEGDERLSPADMRRLRAVRSCAE